jgi:hypothetical protein
VLSLKQQGRLYALSDRPFYRRLCLFNTRWGRAADWAAKAPAIGRLAGAYRAWADELREIPWTPEVKREVDRLVRNLAAQEAAMRAEAAATNGATFRRLDRIAYKLGVRVSQTANAVRGALRIRSIGGDACDT